MSSPGEGFYRIEEKEIPLKEGQFILVSCGTRHSSGFRSNNRPEIMPIRFSVMKEQKCTDHLIKKPFSIVKNINGREFSGTASQ